MLTGVEHANLDAKGRVPVPARLRADLLEQTGGDVVVTISIKSRCLVIYPVEEWRKLEQQILLMPSLDPLHAAAMRLSVGHATPAKLDGNGRIMLTKALRAYASLDKETAFVGQVNRIEIWQSARWDVEVERSLQLLQDDGSELPLELQSLTGIS